MNFHNINIFFFFFGGGGCLFALICKVHHASTKKSASFCILFLSSAVSVIYNFSTVRYIILLCGTVDMGIFYIMFGYCVLGKQASRKRNKWFDEDCERATKEKNEAYLIMQQQYGTGNKVLRYQENRREENT